MGSTIDIQSNLVSKNEQLLSVDRRLAEKETEIQNVLLRFNTEFESLKISVNTDFTNDRQEIKGTAEADRKLFIETFELDSKHRTNLFEQYRQNNITLAGRIISNLDDQLGQAKKLVNTIGNVGVTGNYQNIANENKKTANFFRGIAFLFMSLMSILLIWSIIELSSTDFNLYKSLIRILAAAVLTYPAIYASRESSKHRLLEIKNRNLELELASIGPFIEMLPEDKKQKIKEDLVNKYFGNNDSVEKKTDGEDISIGALERIVKIILPFIKK